MEVELYLNPFSSSSIPANRWMPFTLYQLPHDPNNSLGDATVNP